MSERRQLDQVAGRDRTEGLLVLADHFLQEWQQAHGTPHGSASALTGPDSLAIYIENAFAQAELNLARQPEGCRLVSEYAGRILEQVCAALVGRVETVTRRRVVSAGTSVNMEAGWVMCFYKLDQSE